MGPTLDRGIGEDGLDMTEPLIRLAEVRDVNEVTRLQAEWAEENITYGQTPASAQEIAGKLGPFFYVALSDSRISGFVYGTERVSEGLAVIPKGERYLEIDELYVRPEFRNRGLGGTLMEALVRAARDRGIERFKAYSASKEFDRILAFYRRHGFRPWYAEMFL